MKKIIPVNKVNFFYDNERNLNQHNFSKEKLLKNSDQIKKILIIKWGGMGDVIQSTAIINDILNHFKGLKVDINTLPKWKIFFKYDKRINNTWGFNYKKGFKNFLISFQWIKYVLMQRYDLIIDLQTNDRSRIFLSFVRFLSMKKNIIIGNHFIFPYNISPKNKIKVSQPFLRLKRTLFYLGINSSGNEPKIIAPNSSNKNIIKLLKQHKIINKEIFIFIPGSSASNSLKRWGADNYVKLSKLLASKNRQIILVGGSDDKKICDKIISKNKNIINLCQKISLIDLIPLFKKAKFIIANDTGPTHLTACTSTPTLQILGPTNPFNVKPFGSNIISIQSEIFCKNCYQKICEHHSCMIGLKPIKIYEYIKSKI